MHSLLSFGSDPESTVSEVRGHCLSLIRKEGKRGITLKTGISVPVLVLFRLPQDLCL